MPRTKTTIKRIQLNMDAELIDRVERHQRRTGQTRVQAIYDLVLNIRRFDYSLEDWLYWRCTVTGLNRDQIVEEALKVAMQRWPMPPKEKDTRVIVELPPLSLPDCRPRRGRKSI